MRIAMLPLLALLSGCVFAVKDEDAGHRHVALGHDGNGIALGNPQDWNGLRLNFHDSDLGDVNGVNVSICPPDASPKGDLDGVMIGLLGNKGADISGVAAALYTNAAEKQLTGVHLAAVANTSEGDMDCIGGALLTNTASHDLSGVHLAGVGNLAGEDLTGINLGLLGAAAGGDVTGATAGLLGVAARGDAVGLNVGGLGMSAKGDATGANASLLGVTSGGDVTGVSLAGYRVAAQDEITGITLAGLGISAGCSEQVKDQPGEGPDMNILSASASAVGDAFDSCDGPGGTIRGIALTLGIAEADNISCICAALLHTHAQHQNGLSLSACNDVDVTQRGWTLGLFNSAKSLEGLGFQIGLINHVETNPKWAQWLPLVNWQM